MAKSTTFNVRPTKYLVITLNKNIHTATEAFGGNHPQVGRARVKLYIKPLGRSSDTIYFI